jgi:hypothetical protein
MGVYSDVAVYIYPAEANEEVEAAYKTWMLLNKTRIVDLIIEAGLDISQNFEADVYASGGLKWYGSHVDALMEVLCDELVDLPFLSWEVLSVDEEGYVDRRCSNRASYLLGTQTTFTIDGEGVV